MRQKEKNPREVELNRNRRLICCHRLESNIGDPKTTSRPLLFGLVYVLLKQVKSLDLYHQKALAVCASCTERTSSFNCRAHAPSCIQAWCLWQNKEGEEATCSLLTRGSWSHLHPRSLLSHAPCSLRNLLRGSKRCFFTSSPHSYLTTSQTSSACVNPPVGKSGGHEKGLSRRTEILVHISTLKLGLFTCSGFKTARVEELFLLMPSGKHQKVLPRAFPDDMYYNSYSLQNQKI